MKLQITTVKTAIFALLILSIIRSFPDGYAAIEERAARQLDFYVQSGEIVDQIAWSPSGANIAVVMDQGGTPIDHVVVYDSTTLEELGTIEAPNIWDLAWNSSGSQLATIQSTGRTIIKTWDVSVTPFSLVMEYEDDDPAGVTDLAWRPNSEELTFNRVLAARSIDAQTGVLIRSFTLDEDYTPGPLAWSPDGSKLLVDTARALMWDVNGDLLLDLWSGFFFSPFAWSPDSQQFVVEQGESIQILDAETGALIRTLEGGFGIRTEISWGDTVIAAGRDSVEDFGIYLWDANTGEIMERIDPGAPPNAVALSPDGTQLAYAGVDGTFQVAPVPSGTPNCDPPFTIANDDTAALISAITTANGTPEPDTICLAENGTYTFTAAYSSSNALPKITSEITIEGNNATLTRDAASGLDQRCIPDHHFARAVGRANARTWL
jgi:WD40 repeat protein